MAAKTYTVVFFALFAACLAGVGAFNAYVDPLWLFGHANASNVKQVGFDERQQKTNRVIFGNFPYDALLLGSSRTTFIDQNDFPGLRVFNYAVSGMRPSEYAGYIRHARQRRGSAFDTIFIGIDFFATNRNYGGQALPPEHYIAMTEKSLYRLESLISLDTMKRSRNNLKARHEECDCYNRNNVKTMVRNQTARMPEIMSKDLAVFRHKIYGPDYTYDGTLPETWRHLLQENSGSRFVIFTTPISAPLFATLVETGHFPDLERWLREVVGAFGEVHDFMGVNSITTDLANYQDGGHFYPPVGQLIALRLTGGTDRVPTDFGVRVTPTNLEQHLFNLRRQAELATIHKGTS